MAAICSVTKLLTAAPEGGKRAPRAGGPLPLTLREKSLARTELGEKQICPSCGAKFYDLLRRPAVCPKCTTSFDPAEEGVRVRRGRARVSANDPIYDEDEEVEAEAGGEDGEEEEEAEATPEIDSEAGVEVLEEDEEEAAPAGEELPEGFSEAEEDLGESAEDDSVPLLEDEEEFAEDEIGEISGENEDDDSGR